MYSTALPLLFPEMLDEQSAFLRADGSLLSLYEAFAAVPDPRSRHGQRYDLPSLLTCLGHRSSNQAALERAVTRAMTCKL